MKMSPKLIAMSLMALAVSNVLAGPSNSSGGKSSRAVVYYFDFNVPTITGFHEGDIQKHGCAYFIDKENFLKMLSASDVGQKMYESRDVKAEVKISGGSIYFIDSKGVVRLNKKYFVIDKDAFSNALTSDGPCKAK